VTTTSHPEKEPTNVLNMFMEDAPITVLLRTVSVSIKNILSVNLFQRAKFITIHKVHHVLLAMCFLKWKREIMSKIRIARPKCGAQHVILSFSRLKSSDSSALTDGIWLLMVSHPIEKTIQSSLIHILFRMSRN